MNTDDPYAYPGGSVLRNKLGIVDADKLDRIERRLVAQRAAEGPPRGDFDLKHLRAIHRHLFQDMYDWAGEVRMVEIAKGGNQFQFCRFIETGMADIHRRLIAADHLGGRTGADFAVGASEIVGDFNYVHPFREGNGRAQLHFLGQLADRAGHPLDLGRFDPSRWIEASRAAHNADYTLMAAEIEAALIVL